MAFYKLAKALPCVLCAISVLALSLLGAQGQPTAGSVAANRDPLAIYKATGISKEQEAKLNDMAKSFQDSLAAKAKTMAECLSDMRKYSLQPEPDRAAVLAKQGEINKINSDVASQRISLMLDMRAVLTPEQKAKFVQLLQQPPGRSAAPGGGKGAAPASPGK